MYNPNNKKIVASRDVVFGEEGQWDFETHEKENKFFPPLEEDKTSQHVHQEFTPSTSTTHEDTFPSPESEMVVSSTRTLQDLYDQTERWDSITLFFLFPDCELVDFEEVAQDKRWRDVMDEKIRSIERNDTWELVSLPKGHKAIGVKWVYKAKKNAKGETERYKARLVAKGYSQKVGIDYGDVFAPVASLETIILIISLIAQHKWRIHQMD